MIRSRRRSSPTGAGRRPRPGRAPRRRRPVQTTGFPAGVTLVIAPGGTVTFTITAHVSATYDGTQVTNTATATPGPQHGMCGAASRPARPKTASSTRPGWRWRRHTQPTNPHPVPGQQFTYTVTVTNPGNSATGSGTFSDPLPDPPLDAADSHLDVRPQRRVDLRVAAGEPLTGTGSPAGVPITVAPNGGTVTFTIAVTIRPSEMAVTVDNVGSVTPGTGTACVNGQPTCDGEDTFTATPETALLTITKEQVPDHAGAG